MTGWWLLRLRHRRTVDRIEQALATMDKLPRAVFGRARYRSLDHARIADELGIGVTDVEEHLASAMLHILDHTDPPGGP